MRKTVNGSVKHLGGSVTSVLEKLQRDRRGGVVITFAVTLPMLLLAIGAAIDFGYLYAKKNTLQGAADAGALAAASELHVVNRDKSKIPAVAEATALANAGEIPGAINVSVQVTEDPLSVAVKMTQTPGLYFMDKLMGNPERTISAHAVARVAGGTPLCVLALAPTGSQGIMLQSGARITANECAVYSNSASSRGIMAQHRSRVESSLNCSGGGVKGDKKNFKPMALEDCPQIDDPLAFRQPPPVGGCTENNFKLNGKRTLYPGVYCGGLSIGGSSHARLRPGIYVIKDGALSVTGEGRLQGKNVGFYLIGDQATIKFSPKTEIELSAPVDGLMAGILFFEDRNAPVGRTHMIRSNNAREMVGTVYLSRGVLIVDTTKRVADQSAYTAIIARRLKLFSGPHLTLNTDYDDTDVPVPFDINVGARHVVLSE